MPILIAPKTDAKTDTKTDTALDDLLLQHSEDTALDDLAIEMGEVDSWGEVISKSVKAVPGLLLQGAGGVVRAVEEQLVPPSKTGEVPSLGKQIADVGKPIVERNKPLVEPRSAKAYVWQGVSSFGLNAPYIIGGILRRSPRLALGGLSAHSTGSKYTELRDKGFDVNTALLAGIGYGVAEYVGNLTPIGFLFKQGWSPLKKVFYSMPANIPGEMITEALQIGIDKGIVKENMTFKQAWDRVLDAGIVAVVAGPLQAGVVYPSLKYVDKTTPKQQAQQDKALDKLSEKIVGKTTPEQLALKHPPDTPLTLQGEAMHPALKRYFGKTTPKQQAQAQKDKATDKLSEQPIKPVEQTEDNVLDILAEGERMKAEYQEQMRSKKEQEAKTPEEAIAPSPTDIVGEPTLAVLPSVETVTPLPKQAETAPVEVPVEKPIETYDEPVKQAEVSPAEKPIETYGKPAVASTERGTKLDTLFAVVDANDLTASHDIALNINKNYPSGLQPRQRGRVASHLQVDKIINYLNPEFLGESPKASEGAPIVGKDLIVESGNGRVIALQKGYAIKHDNIGKYRQWLSDNAERFGISQESIEKIDNPVLVRVRQTDVHREKFAREANEQSIAAMSASEQAQVDASMLTPEIMNLFDTGDTGEINTYKNREFIGKFFEKVATVSDIGRYVDSEGYLSQEGVRRISNAIFAKAYGDAAIAEKLMESTDNNIKLVANAMVGMGPKFALMQNDIAKGNLHDFNILSDISQAAKKLSNLKDEGVSVKDYLNQGALFDDGMTPLAKDVLGMFDYYKRSPNKIKEIFHNYIDAVRRLGNPKQGLLIEGAAIPSKADILQTSIKKMEADKNVQATFFKGKDASSYEDIQAARRSTGRETAAEETERGAAKEKELKGGDVQADVGRDITLEVMGGQQVYEALVRLIKKVNPKAAKNIKIINKKKDIGILMGTIASPGVIPGKIRYYVVQGKNAIHTQDRLRDIAGKKVDEIFKGLNKKQMRELEAVSWMGDAEGKNYTAEELSDLGVSAPVQEVYLKQRKFHNQVWRLLAAHRKAYGGETGYIEGHVPHLFENWNVYELNDETGYARLVSVKDEPGLIVGTFRSLREATAFANGLNKDKRYVIKPKTFKMPDELIQKTVLKNSSYFALIRKMEKSFEMTREEAFDAVSDIARRKNRRRYFGNLMNRKGQTGFRRDDLPQILKEYYDSVARYIALDDFKARVIPKFERDFGVELGRASQAVNDKNLARYIEEYINDVNGVPGALEDLIDASIKRYFGSVVRSERPTIWAVNKITHFIAVTKLGLFNLAAGIVNIIQLINTFSKVPLKHFVWGFKHALKPSGKNKAILRRIGVALDLGLSDAGGYSMTHIGGKFVRWSMFFFRGAEHINRRVTALAAYKQAKDKGMSERQALLYARQKVDLTQFDYSVADSARIFRNPAGRLLGQFKPFAIKQIEFVIGLKGAENIKFWIPMLLMSGLGGIPLITGIAEFIEWLTGKDPLIETKKFLIDWAGEDKNKKAAAEIAMYGVASQLGVDISRRVGLGDVLPQRASDLLGPALNTLRQTKKILETGDKTEFVRNVAPSVGNILTALETVKSNMEVEDPYRGDGLKYIAKPLDVGVKAVGLRPLTESKMADIEQIRQYEDIKYDKLVKKYTDKAIEALLNGDAQGVADAIIEAADKGVAISDRALLEEILQEVLTQDIRMLFRTRMMQRPDYMERLEFLEDE